MGINITEIGQKVLDNNTNAANVFRKMYDLHYNPNPLDVPFEYIDENGNVVNSVVPNRSKILKDFSDWKNNFEFRFSINTHSYQDENGNWKNTLAKIGRVSNNGVYLARFILVGDFNYPFQRIEFDFVATKWPGDNNLDVSAKLLYTLNGVKPKIAVDNDGYIYVTMPFIWEQAFIINEKYKAGFEQAYTPLKWEELPDLIDIDDNGNKWLEFDDNGTIIHEYEF